MSPLQHKQNLFWALTRHEPQPTRDNYGAASSATGTSRHGPRPERLRLSPRVPSGCPRVSPRVPSGMDPAVPRATLKVLALCAALLVLVAAVTVAVAVMVWRSEAVGKLRGCRERAANESRELGNRLEELERERERLERDEDALRRELARARGDSRRGNASLVSCRERAVGGRRDGDKAVLGHFGMENGDGDDTPRPLIRSLITAGGWPEGWGQGGPGSLWDARMGNGVLGWG